MKARTLAIFGVGTYILSVISSAEDLGGNSVAPIALLALTAITTVIFIIMATIRLWQNFKIASALLVSSPTVHIILLVVQSISLPSDGSPLNILIGVMGIIDFLVYMYAVALLWQMAKHEGLTKKLLKDTGLTSEDVPLVQEALRTGNRDEVLQRIATAQESHIKKFKETTGIDIRDIIPLIGKEISWADIVNQVFRVLEFDRSDTTIEQNNQVKARKSLLGVTFKPYGHLLVESPILNQKARLPIIHRDDFMLAASVFDVPKLADILFVDNEFLVTYAPKHLLPKGLSGSPHHVLHYVITPRGTLDSYYSMNNDIHMAKPDPQKLFGPFVYQGMIKVQINSEPKL